MTQQRKDFEAWILSEGVPREDLEKRYDEDGDLLYIDRVTQIMYLTWCGARNYYLDDKGEA